MDLSLSAYSSFLQSDRFLYTCTYFPTARTFASYIGRSIWHAIKTEDLTYDSKTQTIQGYDMTTLPADDLVYTYSHYRGETKLADYPCSADFSLSLADVTDVQAGDSFVLSVSSETENRSGSSNTLVLTDEVLNPPEPDPDPGTDPDNPDPENPDNPNPDIPDPNTPADNGNLFDKINALPEPWNVLVYIAGGCLIIMALGALFGRR